MDHNFDFIKLLLDGTSVGAVIIVVIIFLKYAREYNQSLKDISKDFTDRIDKSQGQFQIQIDKLSENFLNNERNYQHKYRNYLMILLISVEKLFLLSRNWNLL
jgi:hypothetical protein